MDQEPSKQGVFQQKKTAVVLQVSRVGSGQGLEVHVLHDQCPAAFVFCECTCGVGREEVLRHPRFFKLKFSDTPRKLPDSRCFAWWQEYLQGEHFVVNSISLDGTHLVQDRA